MALSSAVTPQTGRVAVVTGANKGIGYYIALQLAVSGLFSNIILGCRDASRGQKAVQDIKGQLSPESTTSVSYLPLTIGDASSHGAFKDSIRDAYGKLDVLVNNGAIAFKAADPTPFKGQCKPTLDVNFRGTLDFTEEMLPLVRKGTDPRIVNVASMAGRLSQIQSASLREKFTSPHLTLSELRSLVDQFQNDVLDGSHRGKGWGNSNYGMSKLALIAATKVLAREEQGKVKVNCFCPGYCDTDMSSHKGPRPPADGAKIGVLLAVMDNCPSGEFYENMEKSVW